MNTISPRSAWSDDVVPTDWFHLNGRGDQYPLECLAASWLPLEATPGRRGLRFDCPYLRAEVREGQRGDAEWSVAASNGAADAVRSCGGRAFSRYDAFVALADVIQEQRSDAGTGRDAVVAALVVAWRRTHGLTSTLPR